MITIKKMMMIFVVDTLVMLISWAGLSLIILAIRAFVTPQAAFLKILSIHSYMVVMFCYAFYLFFDLVQFFFSET